MEISNKDSAGLAILIAISELKGSSTTPAVRKHMNIRVANNFASLLTDLYGKQLVNRKKNPDDRLGTGNIWTITGTGKTYLKKYKNQAMNNTAVSDYLEQSMIESKQRKMNRTVGGPSYPLPKVSKGVGQAMDSIALLIEENQKRDALLRSIRSMIDAVLADDTEEEGEELET